MRRSLGMKAGCWRLRGILRCVAARTRNRSEEKTRGRFAQNDNVASLQAVLRSGEETEA